MATPEQAAQLKARRLERKRQKAAIAEVRQQIRFARMLLSNRKTRVATRSPLAINLSTNLAKARKQRMDKERKVYLAVDLARRSLARIRDGEQRQTLLAAMSECIDAMYR